MNHKLITMMSIVVATLMLVSLFAVVSSAASVGGKASGTTAALATKPVGGIKTGTGPAVSTEWSTGYLDFFAVDTSGALWHTSGDGTWDSLGGVCTASPASISWYNTARIDVFVRGSDGAVWHKSNTGAWSGWESLGGQLAPGTGPAVASWSQGRLDVFAEGSNGALYHKWWNGAKWSGWEPLGGKLTASPAATGYSSGGTSPYTYYIKVFVRGGDGAVWTKSWTGSQWSTWQSLGGKLASGTGPAVSGQDLHLFVQGTDHQLWYKNAYTAGTAWSAFPVTPPEALSISSPAATLTVEDHNLVCFCDTSGNVWQSGSDIGGWGQWYSAGSPP
jgi:hypothetical protein